MSRVPLPDRMCFGADGPDERDPDRLFLGDNLQVMKELDDGGIDVIYVDPPFATGTVRRGGVRSPGRSYVDLPDDPVRFVEWMRPRCQHFYRLLTDHGSLFVHLDYRTVHYVKVLLDDIFGRSHFVNEIIWCYSVGGKSKRRFARKHDTILWYARSASYAFFPDAVRKPRKPNSHMRTVRTESGELVQEKTDRKTGKVYRYPMSHGKVPEDWWTDIELLNRSAAERTGWPTQKPERLLQRIIAATTSPDDLVADFFCGSGTTAAVAQRLGRRFLTVDREPDSIECALERLQTAGRALAGAGDDPRDIVCRRWPDV